MCVCRRLRFGVSQEIGTTPPGERKNKKGKRELRKELSHTQKDRQNAKDGPARISKAFLPLPQNSGMEASTVKDLGMERKTGSAWGLPQDLRAYSMRRKT